MPHAAIVVDKRLPAGVFVRLIEGAESFHEVRYQDDVWRVLGQTLPRIEMEGWGPKARVASINGRPASSFPCKKVVRVRIGRSWMRSCGECGQSRRAFCWGMLVGAVVGAGALLAVLSQRSPSATKRRFSIA